jgi:hypothetical protein
LDLEHPGSAGRSLGHTNPPEFWFQREFFRLGFKIRGTWEGTPVASSLLPNLLSQDGKKVLRREQFSSLE